MKFKRFLSALLVVAGGTLSVLLSSLGTASLGIGQELPRQSTTSPGDHTTLATLRQFRVRTGKTISLAAAEPDVVDPVSAAWGSDGKLWVVEMPDYPHPRPDQTELHGRIRVLSNRDSSGRFQNMKTFADGLNFATGVLPWRDGAIVTTAGEILFLRDTDGDGRSDEQNVWFSGFTIDNEQLRANHPTLGSDGLVYVAGGLRGGQITAIADRFDARSTPVSLQNRDFYFDPHGDDWGVVSGKSQFGLTIDDFNRRIGCSNRNPAIESTISADLIDRVPFLNAADGIADVGLAGFESSVSPISDAWTTSNLHAGQFSAACGVCAPGWMADSDGEWLLVCEPTGSLVQRQLLHQADGSWRSEREDQPTEWLACADDWFRPVDVVPDFNGAALVVDMSRAVIEHPHWAPPELKNRLDTWYGNDLGRIWLIHEGETAPPITSVDSDGAALAAIIADDPLTRMLASSYWYANYTPLSLPPEDVLEALAVKLIDHSTPPAGVARIALILNRWGRLTSNQLDLLRAHSHARVRELAAGTREHNRPAGPPRQSVRQLTPALADSSPQVRQSALQSIAVRSSDTDASDVDIAAMIKLAARDGNLPRMQKLLVSLSPPDSFNLLRASLTETSDVPVAVREGWMLRAATWAPSRSATLLANWINVRDRIIEQSSDAEVAMRLATAWKTGAASKKLRKTGPDPWTADRLRQSRAQLDAIDPVAVSLAVGESYSLAARLDAIAWCRTLTPLPTEIRHLVQPATPPQLRAAAYRILMQLDTDWCEHYITDHANEIPPADRTAIVSAAQQQIVTAMWLLTKIETEELPRTFVDPAAMDWFRNHGNSEISALGKRIFAPAGDVAAAMQEYAPALQQVATADVVSGKALFAEHCASCHRIDGVGHTVGPDISDSRTKTPAALLTAILDPNAGIDASYVTYLVLTVDGETITGLLAGESRDAVTLQLAGGHTRRIDRDDIEIFQPSEISLMPSGLQRVLSVDQMGNLLGYLKRWRYVASATANELTE
ncbi:PVC-type heme-binding CxxCH protein [Allorhodopirellula heiligendammensis]|uniref:Cytochrome c n=1 Tax=Allorhodopirellula heiligendammensis TaxID=2714739 RepID=A0A5C6BGF8_9BACT|nr:PVC-type heme-binding CxxCH protein [Allorhodopirellula heiligendammensis]TWU10792.1 Cytochrome c [Allorhodopirellula heiligendammensis]